MVNTLDEALENCGRHIYQATGREVINAPGAAGGMGAALLGLLNAELRAGVEIVVETLQLEQAVKDADLVMTGEGRLARQAWRRIPFPGRTSARPEAFTRFLSASSAPHHGDCWF